MAPVFGDEVGNGTAVSGVVRGSSSLRELNSQLETLASSLDERKYVILINHYSVHFLMCDRLPYRIVVSLELYNTLLAQDHALPGKLEWADGSLFIIELPHIY